MNQNNVYIKVAGTPSAPVIPVNGWVRPTDWLEIDTVADNCINLLVIDYSSIAFQIEMESVGTFDVDWGDGTVQNYASNTPIYYDYAAGVGTSCSQGYKTIKVQIKNASQSITNFTTIHSLGNTATQSTPILAAAFGTRYITNFTDAFSTTNVNSLVLKEVKFTGFEATTTIFKPFNNCPNISKITLPASWGSITNIDNLFLNLKSLDTIILPNSWGNISSIVSLFAGCSALKTVQLPTSWGNIIDTNNMFNYCSSLVKVNLPISWAKVKKVNAMFRGCSSLSNLTLPTSWGAVNDVSMMFVNCSAFSTIKLPNSWGNIFMTASMFYGCIGLNYVELPASWNSVNSAASMFYDCKSLVNINCGTSWGNVNDVYQMFYGCSSLCKVQLPSTWNAENTSLNEMFYQCLMLTDIVLPASWGSITNLRKLFSGCSSLSSIVLPSSWASVTNTSYMFENCFALRRVVLPDNFGNISIATGMFAICSNLVEIVNFDKIGSLTVQADLDLILYGGAAVNLTQNISLNSLLKSLLIIGSAGNLLKISSIRLTNLSSTFLGPSPQVNVSYTSLNRDALIQLFNDLPTLTSKSIRITGCVGTADLTVDDKLIATNKGWNVLT